MPYLRISHKAEIEVLAGAVVSSEGLIREEAPSKMTHVMCLGGIETNGNAYQYKLLTILRERRVFVSKKFFDKSLGIEDVSIKASV